jgi:uncharacterized membrane protein
MADVVSRVTRRVTMVALGAAGVALVLDGRGARGLVRPASRSVVVREIAKTVPNGWPMLPVAGLSADGTYVAGYGFNGVALDAFRSTIPGGSRDLGLLAGFSQSTANGVSADGQVVVGDERSSNSSGGKFVWTARGGMQPLDATINGAFGFQSATLEDVSGDGSTLVGVGNYAPPNFGYYSYRATRGGSFQLLDPLGLFGDDYAIAVSDDGNVVVGDFYYGQAFVWTSSAGMVALPNLPGRSYAVATDVSGDGVVAVGSSFNFSGSLGYSQYAAYRWTAARGTQSLGTLPGYQFSDAQGTNGDGSVVVGTSSNPVSPASPPSRPFLWTPALGMVDLEAYLLSIGATLPKFTLDEPKCVSADGSTIAGTSGGAARSWIVSGLDLRHATTTSDAPAQSLR